MRYTRILVSTVLLPMILLGCRSTSPATKQVDKGTGSQIVGKWHREYKNSSVVDELVFFASGDFSMSDHGTTLAGTYRFIDATHLKLDFGIEAEIYDIVSLSDKELRLQRGGTLEVWTRVT